MSVFLIESFSYYFRLLRNLPFLDSTIMIKTRATHSNNVFNKSLVYRMTFSAGSRLYYTKASLFYLAVPLASMDQLDPSLQLGNSKDITVFIFISLIGCIVLYFGLASYFADHVFHRAIH